MQQVQRKVVTVSQEQIKLVEMTNSVFRASREKLNFNRFTVVPLVLKLSQGCRLDLDLYLFHIISS